MTVRKLTGTLLGLVGLFLVSPAIAVAVGIDDLDPAAKPTVEQGQVFYSDTVSRIAWNGQQACMVSTGTDWKRTAIAKRAEDISAATSASMPYEAAYAVAPDVPFSDLASNTPFLSFLFNAERPTAIRIALGFAVRDGSLRLSSGALPAAVIPARVEPRGDTVIVEDPDAVETLLAAFAAEKTMKIRAQSRKQSGATEHVVSYEFLGEIDPAALTTCQSDVAQDAAIATGSVPTLTLRAVEMDDAKAERMRGMACNRDIDLTGATLARISGPVLGMATPLSHALVLRNSDGRVTDIVSGDLWHLTQDEQGYALRTSRSLTAQSPMGPQIEKSCTRYSEARCATVNENSDDGSINMAECLGVFLSEAYSIGDPDWVQGPIGPLPNATPPVVADPGPGWLVAALPGLAIFPPVFFGTGGGSGSGSGSGSTSTETTTNDPGTVPGRPGAGSGGDPGGDPDPEIVPLPQTLALLITGLLALLGLRRTKPRNTLEVPNRTA